MGIAEAGQSMDGILTRKVTKGLAPDFSAGREKRAIGRTTALTHIGKVIVAMTKTVAAQRTMLFLPPNRDEAQTQVSHRFRLRAWKARYQEKPSRMIVTPSKGSRHFAKNVAPTAPLAPSSKIAIGPMQQSDAAIAENTLATKTRIGDFHFISSGIRERSGSPEGLLPPRRSLRFDCKTVSRHKHRGSLFASNGERIAQGQPGTALVAEVPGRFP
jgi:hypothetical protein